MLPVSGSEQYIASGMIHAPAGVPSADALALLAADGFGRQHRLLEEVCGALLQVLDLVPCGEVHDVLSQRFANSQTASARRGCTSAPRRPNPEPTVSPRLWR